MIYDFTMKDIDGRDVDLGTFKNKVVMIVNVASHCGLTPQYQALQALYERYKDRGFVIAGFPANDFMGQEPGTEEEIKQFCELNYNVTFPLFSKISVKGESQHPLYRFLTTSAGDPALEGDITWNFEKFLADRRGTIVDRFSPKMAPDDPRVIDAIEKALGDAI